jgi:signal transduction histidine kinase
MTEMSPPVLNELGLIPAIEWLTEQIEAQHGINIEVNADNGFTPLQHDIQVLLFQATRELLMNVVKHARARKALVKVSGGNRKIRIEVMDDGRGFDKRQAFRTDVSSGGFGLFSIRERIRHFGGHLIIQSEEGNGTRVVLTAPHTSGGNNRKEEE